MWSTSVEKKHSLKKKIKNGGATEKLVKNSSTAIPRSKFNTTF